MIDKDIRKILIEYIKTNYKEMRIYQEKNIGGAVCDIMLVTDCLTGFEIKSDSDNYERLASQVKNYDHFFDYNYVVVGKSHVDGVVGRIPSYWGIIMIEEDGVTVTRKPSQNPKRDVASQLSILWKVELKNLLNFFRLPMFASKDKGYIAEKIKENVPTDELVHQIAYELLHRDYSVYDAVDYTEYFKNDTAIKQHNQVYELVDSISEMDFRQMSLDEWMLLSKRMKLLANI